MSLRNYSVETASKMKRLCAHSKLRSISSHSRRCDGCTHETTCIRACDWNNRRAGRRRSLSQRRHFWLRASTLLPELCSSSGTALSLSVSLCLSLSEMCAVVGLGPVVETQRMLCRLLKSSLFSGFPVRLLRISTLPVMHPL